MRFTVYDEADVSLSHFATYGEATALAREQSAQAKNPDAVFSVRDHDYGLTLNRFQGGEPLKERIHQNAFLAVIAADSRDQLRRVIAEYADELGVPQLRAIPYDEAVARCAEANHASMTQVFQAAAERADKLEGS